MTVICVTDAWKPQVNGVVRTLEAVTRECEEMGLKIHIIHPGHFGPCPAPATRKSAWPRTPGGR